MAEERTPEQLEQDAIEDKIAGQTVAVEVVNNHIYVYVEVLGYEKYKVFYVFLQLFTIFYYIE